jgi:16S rRNA processing protein RimM
MTQPRIVAGYIRRAHGIRGEVIVRSLSDDPDRFSVGKVLQTDETPPRSLEIARSRTHADGVLLQFASVTDRSAAEALRGVSLTIDATERRQLTDDEFWPDQLVGADVVGPAAEVLGTVTDVVLGDAQDRLVVRTAGGSTVDVPFVSAIVGDVRDGVIEVDPPEGLFPA